MQNNLFKIQFSFVNCSSCNAENRFPSHRISEAKCGKCGKKLSNVSQITARKYYGKRCTISICQSKKCGHQKIYDHIYSSSALLCQICSYKTKTYSIPFSQLTEEGIKQSKLVDEERENIAAKLRKVDKEDKDFLDWLVVIGVIGTILGAIIYNQKNRVPCDSSVEFCKEFSGPTYRGIRTD